MLEVGGRTLQRPGVAVVLGGRTRAAAMTGGARVQGPPKRTATCANKEGRGFRFVAAADWWDMLLKCRTGLDHGVACVKAQRSVLHSSDVV
jgi:hypothetical protein